MSEFTKNIDRKIQSLKNFITKFRNERVIILYSGGVDSLLLCKFASMWLPKENIAALTITGKIYESDFEKNVKRRLTENKININHVFVEFPILEYDKFIENPWNKGYYCGKLFCKVVKNYANKYNYNIIMDGLNVTEISKEGRYSLNGSGGFLAVKEEGLDIHPYVEAGITKEDIRAMAKYLGIKDYDLPPTSCLATAIVPGKKITEDELNKIDRALKIVKNILNVKGLRIRLHEDNLVRIELMPNDFPKIFDTKKIRKIYHELIECGFDYVTLDLRGYKRGEGFVKKKKGDQY